MKEYLKKLYSLDKQSFYQIVKDNLANAQKMFIPEFISFRKAKSPDPFICKDLRDFCLL